jgi:hypothetical protein
MDPPIGLFGDGGRAQRAARRAAELAVDEWHPSMRFTPERSAYAFRLRVILVVGVTVEEDFGRNAGVIDG